MVQPKLSRTEKDVVILCANGLEGQRIQYLCQINELQLKSSFYRGLEKMEKQINKGIPCRNRK
jgi:hypothetical protein